MALSNGLTVENIKVCGKMDNNTEKEYILDLTANREKENGMKAKESNGLNKEMMTKKNENLLLIHSLITIL